jgi:hypothetical protein
VATITKKVDRGIESGKRYQYWKSSENADDGTPIEAGDVFMIEDSLGKPASYFYIETATSTVLSIRLNSRVVTYPLRDARLNWPVPQPDLENPIERFDDSIAAVEIGANEVWEFQGVLPVADVEIVVFSAGSFEIFVA